MNLDLQRVSDAINAVCPDAEITSYVPEIEGASESGSGFLTTVRSERACWFTRVACWRRSGRS